MAVATQINVLEGLSEDEITRLVAVCQQELYEPGQCVFQEGDTGDDLYIVRTGRVRIAKAISLDVDRTLVLLGPGGVFGELAMVGEGTRSATAECVESTQILVLSRDSFEALTTQEPTLGLKVMGRFTAMLADRLRVTTTLLRDTVNWGLEVSGAAQLDLHRVISAKATLSVALINGERIVGQLLKVEETPAGTLLTVNGNDGQLHVIPYHALVALRLSPELLHAQQQEEEH